MLNMTTFQRVGYDKRVCVFLQYKDAPLMGQMV